jgi:hypothetical protein
MGRVAPPALGIHGHCARRPVPGSVRPAGPASPSARLSGFCQPPPSARRTAARRPGTGRGERVVEPGDPRPIGASGEPFLDGEDGGQCRPPAHCRSQPTSSTSRSAISSHGELRHGAAGGNRGRAMRAHAVTDTSTGLMSLAMTTPEVLAQIENLDRAARAQGIRNTVPPCTGRRRPGRLRQTSTRYGRMRACCLP